MFVIEFLPMMVPFWTHFGFMFDAKMTKCRFLVTFSKLRRAITGGLGAHGAPMGPIGRPKTRFGAQILTAP